MSKGPAKHGKKRGSVGSGEDLEPIGESDVEAAFAGIRLESSPIVGEANEDDYEETGAYNEHESSDFAPEQLEKAEIRKADSPTRRAQTQPVAFEAFVEPARERESRDSGKFTPHSVEPATSIVTDELIEESIEAPAYTPRSRASSSRGESSFDVDMDELVAAVSTPEAAAQARASLPPPGNLAPLKRHTDPIVPIPKPPESTPRASSQSLPRVELPPRGESSYEDLAVEVRPATVAPRAASRAMSMVESGSTSLQVGVHESATHLSSASLAIAGAGHAMAMGASGREGLAKLQRACADGKIDALIVGLPGGEWLINAARKVSPAPVVIAACTGKPAEAIRMANAAGADLVAIRPHDAERIATVLLAATRIVEQRSDVVTAQSREANLLDRLEAEGTDDDPEVGGLQPFEMFQRALELELKRVRRYQYALSVALFSLDLPDPAPPGITGILKARAGNALIQSIRDIDMATEIDTGRFLVLLPYTDLTGATNVARRIISAVDALPPVNLGGNEYRAQLTGAIAGAKPGTQVSFGKLIRDANRALEAARRDGAELAVQP